MVRQRSFEISDRPGGGVLPSNDRTLVWLFVLLLAMTLLIPIFEFDAGMAWGVRLWSAVFFPHASGSLGAGVYVIGFICGHWVTCYVGANMLVNWVERRFQTSLLSLMVLTALVGIAITLLKLTAAPMSSLLFFLGPTTTVIGSLGSRPPAGIPKLNMAWNIAAIFAMATIGLSLTLGTARS